MTDSRLTRRDFVRAAVVASAAGLLPACQPTSTGEPVGPELKFEPGQPLQWVNWAGNQACLPAARLAPETEDELVSLMQRQPGTLRPVGAGHSFSPLVPSDGTLIATDLLNGLIATDSENMTSEVWAGTRLHWLGPLLESQGQALSNMPDIDYQTLAGATATSTHGTGVDFGSLSAQIEGLTLATPSGELLECDRERNAEVFHAASTSLGALGVVTRMKIRTQKAFRLVERTSFEYIEPLLEEVTQRAAENRHFECFAFPHSSVAMTQTTNEEDPEPQPVGKEDPNALFELRDAYQQVGGIPWFGETIFNSGLIDKTFGTGDIRVGPSYRVLTHERIARFREMEYTIPAEAGPDCLREMLRTISDKRIPIVYPIEYRYTKQDDVWLSMFNQRDGCSISVHQYADEDHRAYFAEMERIFLKYDGRPHWGKLHSLDSKQLAGLYPRWQDFAAVREGLDPTGKMLNRHLQNVFGESG